MNTAFESIRLIVASPGDYLTRLAASSCELRQAQELRFEVFNLELKEGLEQSYATGRDEDPFDAVCDHLIVEHRPSGRIVGTYRLQTGLNARAYRGYYSEQEFEFHAYERFRNEIIELGRACVHRDHRNLVVLGLLWKGIADYASRHRARYLLGCSSLTSQNSAIGAAAYTELCRHHLAPLEYQTQPLGPFECALDELAAEPPKIPKLLRAYLAIGAKICGPPALDREFKTIDFLTLLDLQSLPVGVRNRFFSANQSK
jgi:putative hemolysin